jgi:hypothetical protein
MSSDNRLYTITFGDQAENHKGMQIIGNIVDAGKGYNLDDMKEIMIKCNDLDIEYELFDLVELSGLDNNGIQPAYVLVIRNGLNKIGLSASDLFNEQSELEYDKHAYMYGRVVNKKARWNICFGNENQEPDYENKKGRIVKWNDVPKLLEFRNKMVDIFGNKAYNLYGEGNYYYNINKCGIGFHGDSERRKVIAIRLGASMPIHYQWYCNNEEVGNRMIIPLNNGDVYIMSEKAVGTDWKKRKIHTLRHATGCDKYIE